MITTTKEAATKLVVVSSFMYSFKGFLLKISHRIAPPEKQIRIRIKISNINTFLINCFPGFGLQPSYTSSRYNPQIQAPAPVGGSWFVSVRGGVWNGSLAVA